MDTHNNEMEADQACQCEGGCHCMGMGGTHHGRRLHRAVRALTAVIVLIFVFWCGFQFGEMRASVGFGHSYGYGMMQNEGYGMMGYGARGATITTSTAVPATGAGTVTIQGQAAPIGPNVQ